MLQPTQYKPKESHPWRRYSVRNDGKPSTFTLPPSKLKVFLTEMVENWDTYSVDAKAEDLYEIRSLKNMTDAKIALWLSDFIRRHFANMSSELLHDPLLEEPSP